MPKFMQNTVTKHKEWTVQTMLFVLHHTTIIDINDKRDDNENVQCKYTNLLVWVGSFHYFIF
jgi:hypothetical protein